MGPDAGQTDRVLVVRARISLTGTIPKPHRRAARARPDDVLDLRLRRLRRLGRGHHPMLTQRVARTDLMCEMASTWWQGRLARPIAEG